MSVKYDKPVRRNLAEPWEVAEYLGVPEATLKQWRYLRKGPTFGMVGRHVRYEWVDVESWWANRKLGGAA